MTRHLVLLLAVLCAACASTGQYSGEAAGKVTTWRAVAVASVGVDVATTLIAQRSGAREQNPVLGQQPQRIVAVNAAILGAIWWLSRDLPPEQQTRIWKWVAAFHLGAAVWNGSQLKR
jgi:hypothetical protein